MNIWLENNERHSRQAYRYNIFPAFAYKQEHENTQIVFVIYFTNRAFHRTVNVDVYICIVGKS
ncbi:hypothetical protein SDC9_80840 [bioreactor metagenome]|uniref:Uncharacterized protein n=1 Tax=bioreactor metagenome TaxID=1076179 RepID=A0A644Z1T4_9ZZZZ